MARKKHTPEQVINKLSEAETAIAIAEGSTVAEAGRRIGVIEQTFYRRLLRPSCLPTLSPCLPD